MAGDFSWYNCGMQDLAKRLETLNEDFLKVYEKLAIGSKLQEIEKLEKEVAEPEIWRDVKKATEKNQELAKLQDETEPWELLKTQIGDLSELLKISDETMKDEFGEQITAMEQELATLKKA